MATTGGGWTVIQNRVDGTMNFNRSWEEYRTGFGDVRTSYWIGDSIRNTSTPNIINGMRFTTYDVDNDQYTYNCATKWGGGWWFNDCTDVFLNGPYNPPENWLQPWYPPYVDGKDVARTKMMIRRR
ncbi:fibrinogen alpha chain-like [Ostrea edulis]|uniref:fibrinogen alpha chain-like n=1 Tax=Ostrea edulis TaxID=37623 RepID=UPI0024AF708D|nr:fibrinogen alpha chain-like [Ostrea edulis]